MVDQARAEDDVEAAEAVPELAEHVHLQELEAEAVDVGAEVVTGAEVDADDRDGPIVVTVRVPAKQAAGTYVGGIFDPDTRAPLGTVTIRVSR